MPRKTTMSYFQEVKSKRYEKIKKLVIQLSPIQFFKLVGLIEVNFGLTRAKANEHVMALVRAGYIETYFDETNKKWIRVVK